LNNENIFRLAKTIDLDLERFRNDIQQKALSDKVEKDFESGNRSGINRTLSFFINGKKYDGEWEEDQLYQYLRRQITGTSM
jgi:protein-disulfide isomerase